MSTPNNDGEKSSNHGVGGKFVKGNKASPGRPPGQSKVAELREKMAQDIDAVIGIVRKQALAGDPQAIRMMLDRILPSLRPVELPTQLDLPTCNLAHQAQAVVQAVAAGDIAPSQAAQVMNALSGVARIQETTDLLERITKLEQSLAKPR